MRKMKKATIKRQCYGAQDNTRQMIIIKVQRGTLQQIDLFRRTEISTCEASGERWGGLRATRIFHTPEQAEFYAQLLPARAKHYAQELLRLVAEWRCDEQQER
jgi:hypothetical protein